MYKGGSTNHWFIETSCRKYTCLFQLISFIYHYPSTHFSVDLIYVSLSLYTLISWSQWRIIIPLHTPQLILFICHYCSTHSSVDLCAAPSTWWALITCCLCHQLLQVVTPGDTTQDISDDEHGLTISDDIDCSFTSDFLLLESDWSNENVDN